MPSQKIIGVLIMCIGLIVSTWLIEKIPLTPLAQNVATTTPVSIRSYQEPTDSTTTAEWQKILTTLDPQNNTVTVVGTNKGSVNIPPEDTTLTNQMAKDYFSQFLIAQKNSSDGTVSADDAATIAQNTLSMPDYIKSTGVQYTTNNLHISTLSDTATVKKYSDDLIKITKNRSPKTSRNEYDILSDAVKLNNPKILTELDPIIAGYRGIVSDLVNMTIPKDAVSVHLGLLNASSNILENIEAMRVAFTDPVKSLPGISQYKQHATDLSNTINALQTYLKSKQ